MTEKPMIDRGSATWMRINAHIQEELATLQAWNEQPLDEIKTATIRGEIKALRALVALASPDVDENPQPVFTTSRSLY